MAINWDSLEKKAREEDAKALKKNPSGYIGQKSGSVLPTKQQKAKQEKLTKKAKDKTITTPNGHTVNAGGRKQLTPEAKLELERQQSINAVPKFLRNMTEAVIDNSVLGGDRKSVV